MADPASGEADRNPVVHCQLWRIAGNDDLGAMSSYLFSAVGFYPEIPGVGGFCLDSRLFSQVIWRVGNGAPCPTPWLPHSRIEYGATLVFVLGGSPYTPWGSSADRAPAFIWTAAIEPHTFAATLWKSHVAA